MRLFKNQIFLGSGIYSEFMTFALHLRLNEAFNHLGGNQQPARPESNDQEKYAAIEEEQTRISNEKIEDVIQDVIAAFGFKPVELLKMNYEPDKNSESVYDYITDIRKNIFIEEIYNIYAKIGEMIIASVKKP